MASSLLVLGFLSRYLYNCPDSITVTPLELSTMRQLFQECSNINFDIYHLLPLEPYSYCLAIG